MVDSEMFLLVVELFDLSLNALYASLMLLEKL